MTASEARARGEAQARRAEELAVVEIEDLIVHYESEGDPRNAAALGMARHALDRLRRALGQHAGEETRYPELEVDP